LKYPFVASGFFAVYNRLLGDAKVAEEPLKSELSVNPIFMIMPIDPNIKRAMMAVDTF